MKTTSTAAIIAMAFFLSAAGVPAVAEEGDELGALMSDGKVTLDFRYRYELVDQDSISKDANAHTVRTRLGFQSGNFRGWDFNLEVNDVRHLSNDFNAGGGTTPDRAGVYPVVADPKGTRLNQGYINYSGIEDWGFKVGRQRINLDNQRFVGGVGWRQTEQVFDAGRVSWGNDTAQINYTYVQWVRRIFGPNSSAGKHRQDGTHLVNGSFNTPIGKIVGYYYHLDNEDAPAFSSATVGARLSGKQAIGENWAIRYEGEYATQSDAGNNPVDYDADYWHLDAGAVVGIFDFGAGWEVLSGDADTAANEAFRTPLATLHAFNGWADQFLTTPAAGLSDYYLKFKATPGDFIVQARYHHFEEDDGSDTYGEEIDLQVGYKFNKRFRADLYLAEFDGDSFGDVTKFWVQLYFKL
jgi:hypothetical protein